MTREQAGFRRATVHTSNWTELGILHAGAIACVGMTAALLKMVVLMGSLMCSRNAAMGFRPVTCQEAGVSTVSERQSKCFVSTFSEGRHDWLGQSCLKAGMTGQACQP